MASSRDNQSIFSLDDFKFLLRIIQNNWWIPLAIVPVFWLISYFYSYRLTPIYQVKGEILLQNNDSYYKSSLISEENFLAAAYMDNSNEQRVIKSYDLIKSVVEKLKDKLEVSYYIVGKVRTTEQFSGMPFSVEVKSIDPSFYEKTFDLRILNQLTYEIKYELNNKKITLKGYFGKPIFTDFFLFIIHSEFSKSIDHNILNSGFSNIFYQFRVHTIEYVINNIRSSLKVENPEYTNFLIISLEDIIPERSQLILDSLINAYLKNRIKLKFDLNQNTINYIDKQLDEISIRLSESLDTLLEFKKNKSIINLGWEESSMLSRISALEQEISSINIQFRALDDLEKYILENKDPQFLPPNSYMFENEGYLNKASLELYNKQLELNKILQVAKPNNITVLEVKEYINRIKTELLIYINNTRNALKAKKENIYKEFSKYLQDAKNIDPKQQELNNITRLLKINENIYNFLLEKRANTLIARASIVPDVKVVERPRNFGVIWPDKNEINKKFIIAGLIISIIITIIRSIWFTKISSLDHLKELTDIPALGILPKVKRKENVNELFVFHSPNSNITESLRAIKTNLQYINVGSDLKTILFTSYYPAEGKTFVSLNIAGLFAKTGKKVVLLELDLHKPRIFSALGITNPEKGITTYLNNIHTLDEITYIHPNNENLHILFTGIIPPNPSDYIISEKLNNLILNLKKNYDYIIIDSPPAGLLTDSIYLMQFADVGIFVVNSEKANHREIQFINNLVKTNSFNNIYIILNSVKQNLKKYYYSGYGYAYGYGYQYGKYYKK
ncbi:MAG: polysaccharide biosynthesis tyrosine autokinase [Bacteroidia bacterium]|nr:polysaccharide biosynthesis tyrosine autokinase [Bacteroidia bacterium]